MDDPRGSPATVLSDGPGQRGPRRAARPRKVRVGVAGLGRIGEMHCELLSGAVAGARLQAVFDLEPGRAGSLADRHGVRAARGFDELLGDDIDAVAICTPTDAHAEQVSRAAGAGVAIFCEKPLALDRASLERAAADVEAAGVTFQIGFNRRFDPAHASVRDAVASGRIGELHLLRITSRDPAPPSLEYVRKSGGLFLDMTIHDFDMARFITGSEVVEVYARAGVRVDPRLSAEGDVDTAAMLLEHADGCLTTIDNSRRAVYGYDQRVEAFGSRGAAASENPPAHHAVLVDAAGRHLPAGESLFVRRYRESYRLQWEAFAAAVADGRQPAASVADARAPLLIGLAAARSLDEHRPVKIQEIEREGRGTR
ncbi:MAG TPA: inositol 2-dehydrogenase [Solirubrobacteraceae bacterium]|nr:inositol 2-dehydrogenase [Solirubrobacteraceae bacterium]